MITDTELRDCYYIYRAMHDGVCPSCGHHDEGKRFEYGDSLMCPNCNFYMNVAEIQAITKQSNIILKRRLESFRRIRGELVN